MLGTGNFGDEFKRDAVEASGAGLTGRLVPPVRAGPMIRRNAFITCLMVRLT